METVARIRTKGKRKNGGGKEKRRGGGARENAITDPTIAPQLLSRVQFNGKRSPEEEQRWPSCDETNCKYIGKFNLGVIINYSLYFFFLKKLKRKKERFSGKRRRNNQHGLAVTSLRNEKRIANIGKFNLGVIKYSFSKEVKERKKKKKKDLSSGNIVICITHRNDVCIWTICIYFYLLNKRYFFLVINISVIGFRARFSGL